MNDFNKIHKIFSKYNIKNKIWPARPTAAFDVEDIARRSEDRGFFEDIVEWLRRDSPRRLKRLLGELRLADTIPYERLCRAVAATEFRASPVVERRMALGPGNEWVRQYFEDFPGRGPKA